MPPVDELRLPDPQDVLVTSENFAADPSDGGNNYDANRLTFFGKDGSPGTIQHALYRASMAGIPAKAKIASAVLELLPSNGDLSTPCLVNVGLVPRDGRWDDVSQPIEWVESPTHDNPAIIFTAFFASVLGGTGVTPGSFRFGVKDIIVVGGQQDAAAREVGQAITIATTGVVGVIALRLRRVGTVAGNIRCRIERCVADDGSDDRPDGVPIYTAAGVPASGVSTATTGDYMGWGFTDGPTLIAGQRYCFIMESDYVASSSNYIQFVVAHGDAYPDGGIVAYGRKSAWGIIAYPSIGDMPWFFETDLTTPKTAPFGTMDVQEVPICASDVWFDAVDLTTQIQEWVDDPLYVDDVVGIQLFTDDTSGNACRRRLKDFRLRVTWTPNASGSATMSFTSQAAASLVLLASASATSTWIASAAASAFFTFIGRVAALASAARRVLFSAGPAPIVRASSRSAPRASGKPRAK